MMTPRPWLKSLVMSLGTETEGSNFDPLLWPFGSVYFFYGQSGIGRLGWFTYIALQLPNVWFSLCVERATCDTELNKHWALQRRPTRFNKQDCVFRGRPIGQRSRLCSLRVPYRPTAYTDIWNVSSCRWVYKTCLFRCKFNLYHRELFCQGCTTATDGITRATRGPPRGHPFQSSMGLRCEI